MHYLPEERETRLMQKWELRGYWEKVLQRNWFQGRKGIRREGQAAREGQGWNNPGMGRARNRAGNCSEKRSKSYKKFFRKQRSVMWFLLHEINEQKDTSWIFISLADIDSCFRGKRSFLIHIHSFQKSGFNLCTLLQDFWSHNLHSLLSLLRSSRSSSVLGFWWTNSNQCLIIF